MRPLSLSKPHLIIMVGIPGSGKSFFAEHFAETFGVPLVSSNQIRQILSSNPTFLNEESSTVDQIADYTLSELLKTKQTVLYEGSTWSRTSRQELAKKARASGYETLLVWTQTEMAAARARSTKRGRDRATLSVEQFERQAKQFTAPNQSEKPVVISGKHTYASQLKIVLKKLTAPRVQIEDRAIARRTVTPIRVDAAS